MPDLDPTRYSLTARWVFPVSSPPLANGVIEIESGLITAVHNCRPNPETVDCGNVALLPGLVNAHTHLEFSDLQRPVEPALPFTQWIKSLVGVRRERPATEAVILQGLTECQAAATQLLGEIATQDWSTQTYLAPGIRTIVFRELIGMLPDRAAAQLEIARKWLGESDTSVTRGLSPHAPYSVHPDLYRDLIQLAAEKQAPVAIHLAETLAELELLDRGTGEFVEMLQRFNAWDQQIIPRGTRPLDYLRPLSAVRRGLVIHGNYLESAEFDWLEKHPQVSVVYCPRTHAYFQHSPHPWRTLLDRGINVALGTDSRGSNPDLSLWREMQFLVTTFPDVDPAQILAMGTQRGAEALGVGAEMGSLEPGKQSQWASIPLPETRDGDPYRLLFAGS
ncbi:MAG: Chlorohydrolase [Planctomycetaceae bacterium]|nr:Chlorohydrolase [Planctomycetaceae bacterium]